MALTVTAKVTNIFSLAEARFCAGMGVEIISFPLETNGISLEEAASIAGWLAGINVAVDARNLSEETLKSSIEFLQPSYLVVTEFQINAWAGHGEPGFILSISDANLSDIAAKINTYKEKTEFIEIVFQPEWITPENDDLFLEISNHSRIIISFDKLEDMDNLFRIGKIFRAVSLDKSKFTEDEFRQAIEMFEEMD